MTKCTDKLTKYERTRIAEIMALRTTQRMSYIVRKYGICPRCCLRMAVTTELSAVQVATKGWMDESELITAVAEALKAVFGDDLVVAYGEVAVETPPFPSGGETIH